MSKRKIYEQLNLETREFKIKKYLNKRKKRTWKKKTEYKVRQNHANSRPRGSNGVFLKKEPFDEVLYKFLIECGYIQEPTVFTFSDGSTHEIIQ